MFFKIQAECANFIERFPFNVCISFIDPNVSVAEQAARAYSFARQRAVLRQGGDGGEAVVNPPAETLEKHFFEMVEEFHRDFFVANLGRRYGIAVGQVTPPAETLAGFDEIAEQKAGYLAYTLARFVGKCCGRIDILHELPTFTLSWTQALGSMGGSGGGFHAILRLAYRSERAMLGLRAGELATMVFRIFILKCGYFDGADSADEEDNENVDSDADLELEEPQPRPPTFPKPVVEQPPPPPPPVEVTATPSGGGGTTTNQPEPLVTTSTDKEKMPPPRKQSVNIAIKRVTEPVRQMRRPRSPTPPRSPQTTSVPEKRLTRSQRRDQLQHQYHHRRHQHQPTPPGMICHTCHRPRPLPMATRSVTASSASASSSSSTPTSREASAAAPYHQERLMDLEADDGTSGNQQHSRPRGGGLQQQLPHG